MASSLVLWMTAFLFGLVEASPTISFPINAQVPPISRPGEPFSFVFSPSTFSSDSPISYTLSSSPSWLSIDSDARRLYGTPQDGDIAPGQVVGVPIELVATDATGDTQLAVTLVVSRDPTPTIEIPLSVQIAGFGSYSEPSSTLYSPDKDFTFAFAEKTFSKSGLNYYALSGDNSPLPAWISFDPSRLAFAGRTPPLSSLIEPPQAFPLKLVASDVTGFSAVEMQFAIVVGKHEITVDNPVVALNVTIGTHLLYNGLRGLVKVDGQPAEPETLTATSPPDMPTWLSFNQATWDIEGTPPPNAKDSSFSLIFKDTTSDIMNVTVQIHVATGLFRDTLTNLSVELGGHFSFDLRPHLWNPSDIQVTTKPRPPADWISFEPTSLTFLGDVPTSLSDRSITIAVLVRSKASGAVEGQNLTINAVPTGQSSSTTLSTGLPTASASTAPTGSNGQEAGAMNQRTTVLLAALISALLFLVVIAIIIFCLCRRRRRRLSRRLERRDISGPLPGSFVINGAGDSDPALGAASKEYDIENQRSLSDPFRTGQLGNTDNIPPIPRPPPLAARRDIRPVSVHTSAGECGSWLSGGTAVLMRKKSKKTKRKSYLSDTSLYMDDPNTLNLLGYGGEKTLRSGPDTKFPALGTPSSIQRTPDIAYSGPQRDPLRQNSPEDPDLAEVAVPLRPKSRLDCLGSLSYDKPLSRPLPKGARLPRAGPPIKQRKKPTSLSTISAYSDRELANQPTTKGTGIKQRLWPEYTGSKSPVQPLPLHIARKRTETRRAADTKAAFPGTARAARSTSPDAPAMNTVRESWAKKKAAAAGRQTKDYSVKSKKEVNWGDATRDSLGISYEELVQGSPFHPSETWSTSDEPNWTINEVPSLSHDWSGVLDFTEEEGSSSSGQMSRERSPMQVQGVGLRSSCVGQAVSRYSKLNVGDERYGENGLWAGSSPSGRSGISGASDDFAVYI